MVLLLLVDLDQDLAALGPLGGFFVLRTGGAPHAPAADAGGRVHGVHRLGHTDTTRTYATNATYTYENQSSDVFRNPITFRVEKVAHSLRAPEMRIAASVAQQGLAARLWSVTLACAVLYGSVPDLDPGLLHWDPDAGAPDDLWLSEVRPLPADAATLADLVLEGHLEPLGAALRARHRIAPGLLRGNAGIRTGGRRPATGPVGPRTRAPPGRRAHPLPDRRTSRAPSAVRHRHPHRHPFRRRSCCLYYRVPGGGVCGDCCFTRPPRSSAHDTSG